MVAELTRRIAAKINSGKGEDKDVRILELFPRSTKGSITDDENDQLFNLLGVMLPRPGSRTSLQAGPSPQA